MKKLTLANALTGFRLAGALVLVFAEPISIFFYVLYTLCGITDVLDGTVARVTGSTSEFGAKLDSVADLTFYAVMIFRFFPIFLKIVPGWVWIWIFGIVFTRLLSYITAALKFHRFASLHTWLNKITGFLVFSIPYLLQTSYFIIYISVLCVIASAAVMEELIIHFQSNEYKKNNSA